MQKLAALLAITPASPLDAPSPEFFTGAILAVSIVIFLVVFLLIGLPSIIIHWKLFRKAGKPGWAWIVPVYGYIVMSEIAKKPIWMGALVTAPIIFLSVIPFVNIAAYAVSLVFGAIVYANFINQYDRGTWFWLGVLFLPIVAVFFVGRAQYVGTETADQPEQRFSPPPAVPPASSQVTQ